CRHIPAPDRADFCTAARAPGGPRRAGGDDELLRRMEGAGILHALAERTRQSARLSPARNLTAARYPHSEGHISQPTQALLPLTASAIDFGRCADQLFVRERHEGG